MKPPRPKVIACKECGREFEPGFRRSKMALTCSPDCSRGWNRTLARERQRRKAAERKEREGGA